MVARRQRLFRVPARSCSHFSTSTSTFLLDLVSPIFHCQDDESVKKEDDVRRRSYNEPTLEDKFDKSQMPKPMQVRPVHTGIFYPLMLSVHSCSVLSYTITTPHVFVCVRSTNLLSWMNDKS